MPTRRKTVIIRRHNTANITTVSVVKIGHGICPVCPACGCDGRSSHLASCPECGAPPGKRVKGHGCCRTAILPDLTTSTSGLARARRFIQVKALTQLYQNPSLQQPLDYYTAPQQTYALMDEQGQSYAIWCGGQQQAWISAAACVGNVRDVSQDVSAVIPGFLTPAKSGDKRNYHRIRLVPMPLTSIPYGSTDYRVLYQWLGDPVRYEPDMIGFVREVTQIASTTRSVSMTEQRMFGLRSVSQGETISINQYQIFVEDQHETVRAVTIRQQALYLPHRGDYVVLWIKPVAGEHVLVQASSAIRRILRSGLHCCPGRES